MQAPSEAYHNLEDADLVFDPAKNAEGEEVEVTGSNFVPIEMGTDRVLRENAFRSFYKGYRQHINTMAATYAGAVKAATAEARARHYESSRAMSMAGRMCPWRSTTTCRHRPQAHARHAPLRPPAQKDAGRRRAAFL